MAAKRRHKSPPTSIAARKAAKKRKKKKYVCSLPDICAYLTELSKYIKKLDRDHERLRDAVCQLESVLFDGKAGVDEKRICPTGGGEDSVPPTPPLWPS